MADARDGRASTTLRGKGNTSVGGGRGGGSGSAFGGASTASSTGGSGAVSSGVAGRGGAGMAAAGRSGGATADFAMRLAGIESRLSLMEMGARAGQISFTSLMDGDLKVLDLRGELKMKIGLQSDGKPGISYANGTAPPKPTVPLVSARQLYIVVGWDGTFTDSAPRPSDLARVDVHVSTDADFDPDGTTAVGSLFAEGVCVVPADIEDHWVRLVAVTLGDVPSPPTDAVLVRPLPADKIAAESIAAVHLASEIILSTTIVAGDPTGAHMELNASGLRMVRADQTPTVVFSADEGNALITGSIQTALRSSGKSRIVFNPFPDYDWNEIRFYAPNDATWSSVFASRDRNGRNGALGLQGFRIPDADFVMAQIYGEDHLLTGVFNIGTADSATGTVPFTDGMLASPAQTGLVGSGGPFLLHNYKRATPTSNPISSSIDPFIGFTNTATSAVNGTSVLEFHEFVSPNGVRLPCIRNLGTAMGLHFGDRQQNSQGQYVDAYRFAFKNYDFNANEQYVPIATSGLAQTSSQTQKTDIDPLADHVDPLKAMTAVEPVRFRYIAPAGPPEPAELWLPDLAPVAPDDDTAAALDADLAEVRESAVDGLVPVPVPAVERPSPPQYGLIAEQVALVAPDAVVSGGSGPMLDHGSLIALVWAAAGKLAARTDDLTTRIAALEAA